MSYVDKKDEEKKEDKVENPLKAMFADSTVVETPEDVIEKDTDINRKNAFKRAYERILELFPEAKDKKKKKKKGKEEFDKNLSIKEREQSTQQRAATKENKTKDNEIER